MINLSKIIFRRLVPAKMRFNFFYHQWLSAVQQLEKTIFSFYLKRDYPDNHYFYEKILQEKWVACLEKVKQLNECVESMSASLQTKVSPLFKKIELMNEMMITLANLRYRVKDFSTFEVCEKELSHILAALIQALKQLRKKAPVVVNEKVISDFETIYSNTLQLITNEPYVFLIFISNLRQIFSELALLSEQVSDA